MRKTAVQINVSYSEVIVTKTRTSILQANAQLLQRCRQVANLSSYVCDTLGDLKELNVWHFKVGHAWMDGESDNNFSAGIIQAISTE
jgi:hypothetical protein